MPPSRVFTCECGGEYSSQKGLDQHKRRYCRGATSNENKCDICGTTYNTYAGLRQHMKKTHKDEYNREMQEEARAPSRFWTADEENELARAEAEYTGSNLLDYLLTKTSRSKDAIKGRRKQQTYIDKVRAYRQELEQNATTPASVGISEGEQNNRLNQQLREALSAVTGERINDTTARLRDEILNLPTEVARQKLEEWCKNWVRVHGRSGGSAGRNQMARTYKALQEKIKDQTISARRRRGFEFRLAQLKYKKDRRAFANALLDDMGGETDDVRPTKENIEESYREIFGAASVEDNETITVVSEEQKEISYPVSAEEIQASLKQMSNGAPGPDGITLSRLKRVNITDLLILFNSMLLLETTPAIFKKSRTTLIPKTKRDKHIVKNWRPITVSSIVIRLLGKILARRVGEIELHRSQRGFSKIDGCFGNSMILENIIKHRRKRGQPLTILSLDLKKAFDCVSHNSIKRALDILNIDKKFTNYIMDTYKGATTTIACGGTDMGTFEVNRGVKQGDPLSPFLFNAVLDELLRNLHKRSGVPLGQDEKVCCLAYADDIILLSETPEDGERMLNTCVEFFNKRGLALNAGKCTAMILKTVPSKKKLCVVTDPTFKVGDTWIPQLNINEEFRYLGRKFNVEGSIPCDAATLHQQLSALLRAPLKPQQKFDILKTYLLPRYIDSLQRPNVTKRLLQRVDLQIRTAVKKMLHLPLHCNNSILYAQVKMGGLGLFNFEKIIPVISLSRWNKLEEAD